MQISTDTNITHAIYIIKQVYLSSVQRTFAILSQLISQSRYTYKSARQRHTINSSRSRIKVKKKTEREKIAFERQY